MRDISTNVQIIKFVALNCTLNSIGFWFLVFSFILCITICTWILLEISIDINNICTRNMYVDKDQTYSKAITGTSTYSCTYNCKAAELFFAHVYLTQYLLCKMFFDSDTQLGKKIRYCTFLVVSRQFQTGS